MSAALRQRAGHLMTLAELRLGSAPLGNRRRSQGDTRKVRAPERWRSGRRSRHRGVRVEGGRSGRASCGMGRAGMGEDCDICDSSTSPGPPSLGVAYQSLTASVASVPQRAASITRLGPARADNVWLTFFPFPLCATGTADG